MTDAFLPRPSPDHHVAFECDSNGHLPGQDDSLIIHDADQEGHCREGGGYISRHGARKKEKKPGLLMSNHHSSYPRAANAKPSSSPVSCFIPFSNAPPTIGRTPPSFMLFFVLVTHSLLPLSFLLTHNLFHFQPSQVFLCCISFFQQHQTFITNPQSSLCLFDHYYHTPAQVR